MSDPRLTPANDRVAHVSLRHLYPDRQAVKGVWMRVTAPVADLRISPDRPRARQMLAGARFLTLDRTGDWVFGQSGRDGYVGWVLAGTLGPDMAVSHRISALSTHVYPAPDLKVEPVGCLPCGALVAVAADGVAPGAVSATHAAQQSPAQTAAQSAAQSAARGFAALSGGGFVPWPHLTALDQPAADPVDEALRFVGVPYLWGGNSAAGIDCSGLVQVAFWGCGLDCPGDSDMQRATVGVVVDSSSPPLRGDLIFWDGHVALCAGSDQIVHANAYHMAVTVEGFTATCARIVVMGGGAVRAIRRIGPDSVRFAGAI